MPDEKWNRFASTGSVRDYLDYCACSSCEEPERGRVIMKRESGCFEQVKGVKLRGGCERGKEIWGRPSC